MSKRVLIISQTESHLTQRGKRHPNLADFLASKGVEVNYFSSSFYHADKRQFTADEIERANNEIGYDLHIIKSISYYRNVGIRRIISNLQFSWKVYRRLKKQDLSKHVIIVPSRPVEMTRLLSKLKNRRPEVDILMDIRDVWPDAFNIKNKYLKKFFELYCNFFLKNKVSTVKKFVHTCPNFMNWLNRYAPKAESTFIPLGYDPARFDLTSIDAVQKDSDSNGKVNFVYIGLLQYQIEMLPFIKAIQDDDRFTLTLYGDDGKGERYNETVEYIAQNAIKNVQFKGTIAQDKVGVTLSKYDIGLVPMNAVFAFPNKVFDYIAMKLPIFSMGDHDTSNFVKERNIGWYSNNFEVENIKRELEKIGEPKKGKLNEFVSRMGEIRENFSRENLYIEFLKKLKE